MILTEIFVENNPLDVSEDISTLLTFTIDDIKDFSSRNTTFSKTIVLPGTSRNNAVFGNIFQINNGNFYDATKTNIGINYNAAKSAQCFMFMGGIQVFKGIFRILEIIIDGERIEYECAVFGELGGLIAKLGNKKLEDLDFSAYNHIFNVTNIVNSWSAAKGSGYYYPLIDYGTYSINKKDWDIRTLRPALYVKEYIDKIFTASGYTYQCALFNTPRFKTLVIPHNRRVLTNKSQYALNYAATSQSFNETIDGFAPLINWNVSIVAGSFSYNSTTRKFTYSGIALNSIITTRLIGGYDKTVFGTNFKATIVKEVAGVETDVGVVVFGQDSLSGGFDITVNSTAPVAINPGDIIFIRVRTTSSQGNTYNLTVSQGTLQIGSAGVDTAVGVGENFNINFNIPQNIKQLDFLASLVKLFNLYVFEDKDQLNKIFIKPYTDFFDTNLTNAVDWTYKIDRSKPLRVKPMSELTARYYEFKFKSDSDFYSEQYRKRYNLGYGDIIFDSKYEFAQDKTTIELIFSSTVLVGYTGEAKVYPTLFKKSGTVEETIDGNIRIMQTKKIAGVPSWDIKDGSTVLGSYTTYGYGGHLDDPDAPANDLNFGAPKELFFVLTAGALNVNQFNVYWSPYMAEITDKDSRLLTCYARLTPADINSLDFSKYVWVDGVMYGLNKIEDYNASYDDVCKLTLLKIVDTNAIAAAPSFTIEDQYTSIPATGTEGTQLISRTLQNKIITFLMCGDKALVQIYSGSPGVNEFIFDSLNGLITFGVPLQAGQIVQILYRTA